MKHLLSTMTLVLGIVLAGCDKDDGTKTDSLSEDIHFEEATYSFANAGRPYRRAEINPKAGVTPAVVVYLHGGSARGEDNTKQMDEPAVLLIAEHIRTRGISAVFLVPQCPETDSQGKMMDWVKMAKALEYLIGKEKKTAAAKVYIFGGSMGGTGTWNMLSTYPDLFTSAMACAGNPKGCSAEKVAQTPVYAVMGSADKIMRLEEVNLQTFLDAVGAGGGEYRFDTEAGWDHEKTCKESYTSSRLDWVFSHR